MGGRNSKTVSDTEVASSPVVYLSKPLYSYRQVLTGLVSPVAYVQRPETEEFYAVDQVGMIYRQIGSQVEPFLDIRDSIGPLNLRYDERGLLDMTFAPWDNTVFYMWYSVPSDGEHSHNMVLEEWTLDGEFQRRLIDWAHPQSNHNGGSVAFGRDGLLYFSTGDGGGAGDPFDIIGNAQNPDTPWGKIWRMDVRMDNPQPELYTYGLRNPWRFSFRSDGSIILGDVGQDLWEGVHIVREPDENHGWKAYENGHIYDAKLAEALQKLDVRIVMPILNYGRKLGGSVIGGYENEQGEYIFGDWLFEGSHDNVFMFYNNVLYVQPRPDSTRAKHVNSFSRSTDGSLFLLAKDEMGLAERTGKIYRIVNK